MALMSCLNDAALAAALDAASCLLLLLVLLRALRVCNATAWRCRFQGIVEITALG